MLKRRAKAGTFVTTPPRPVAPTLHYQTFALAQPVRARYVRLVVTSTQGVAQYAAAAELQVFSTARP